MGMGIRGLRVAGVAAGYMTGLVIDKFYIDKRENSDKKASPVKVDPFLMEE